MAQIRKCRSCGRYSLREECPDCGGPTVSPHPHRYSPQDRYARYRRALLATVPESQSPRSPGAP
jgi:H/ACA ribonucleoprotein complex subunit 3